MMIAGLILGFLAGGFVGIFVYAALANASRQAACEGCLLMQSKREEIHGRPE
ncbi:MAG: hypothetical protein M1353_00640 [Nitrospirae bacterium]|nr:hypothetical protein [Nitrospirota bacterium]